MADSSGGMRPASPARVVDAYGGADRWRDISGIEADLFEDDRLRRARRGLISRRLHGMQQSAAVFMRHFGLIITPASAITRMYGEPIDPVREFLAGAR
ncbi:hypothetical protein [Streptomyces xantholiticus]|uniref:hypothetical protein n=1 Tax=Streptomyces xantholiticus TaxID=68285 RepID=UPI001674EEF1|nr:hypothetical protein [Streptomyces xantholiticus]GGW58431.1 hypothetical protein GCM10010381_49400 [Streptomyces xantholiticus]